jgi:hypothetical protein
METLDREATAWCKERNKERIGKGRTGKAGPVRAGGVPTRLIRCPSDASRGQGQPVCSRPVNGGRWEG